MRDSNQYVDNLFDSRRPECFNSLFLTMCREEVAHSVHGAVNDFRRHSIDATISAHQSTSRRTDDFPDLVDAAHCIQGSPRFLALLSEVRKQLRGLGFRVPHTERDHEVPAADDAVVMLPCCEVPVLQSALRNLDRLRHEECCVD